jgi:hypothetical protein
LLFSASALAVGVQFKAIAFPAIVPVALSLVDHRRFSGSAKSLAVFSVFFGLVSVLLLFLTGYELSYMGQLQGGAVATHTASAQSIAERALLLWNYVAMVPTGYLGDDKNYSYWPLFFSASAVLWLGLIRRKNRSWALLAIWWGASVCALLFHQQVWHHHILLVSPALALSIGAFGALALEEPKGRWRSAMVFVLAFTFLFSFRSALEPIREIKGARAEWEKDVGPILKHIVEKTSDGAFILVDQPFFAVATGRHTYPELVDPSKVRIRTGSLRCETMDKLLNDSRTEMVLMERRFRALDCGGPFEEKVRSIFPAVKSFALGVSAYTRN